jgi:hypothetical protein
MPKRIHVIKETKSPNFTTANFDVSKNLVKASSLGLKPTAPDYAALNDALAKDKGASVAYELTCDGATLTFDVRYGKQRKTLADVKLASFDKLEERRKVMNALLALGLVDKKDVPASADEVTAKEKDRDAILDKAGKITGRLLRMDYEKSVDDTPANDLPAFTAWVRKKGHGKLVDRYEAARGKSGDPERATVVKALDKLLKDYQAAARKLMESERGKLEARAKAIDGELRKMTAP